MNVVSMKTQNKSAFPLSPYTEMINQREGLCKSRVHIVLLFDLSADLKQFRPEIGSQKES